jgi:deoxyribodipyrimidine photo-lyase
MKNALLWIRRELRLHDNEALVKAAAGATNLMPVYILPSRELLPATIGLLGSPDYLELPFDKTGPHRRAYLMHALQSFKQSLRDAGSDLLFAIGNPAEVLRTLSSAASTPVTDLYTTELPGTEETDDLDAVEAFCEEADIRLHVYEQHTMLHPDDLPFEVDAMPDVFSAFRKKVEKLTKVRPPLPTPRTLPPLPLLPDEIHATYTNTIRIPGAKPVQDHRAALPTDSSEQAALRHVQHYIWQKQHILTYKETRNGLIGRDYSSKLSGWLAVGSLSARNIYQEVRKFEEQVHANDSTYWLIFELLWRDFFQFQMMKFEGLMFTKSGLKGLNELNNTKRLNNPGRDSKSSRNSPTDRAFNTWCNAQTPSDFINANMLELAATGFMSNRGRQNVASYLAKTLSSDWRQGAAWFEHHLLDYDSASNWGNWAYVAGTGSDPRDRVFNVERQAEMYDPDYSYRKLWL